MAENKIETKRSIGLKLKLEIYEKIVAMSEKENRTINNMVETIILRTIEKPEEL